MIRVTFRYSCYTVSCPLAKGWTAKTRVPLGEVQVSEGWRMRDPTPSLVMLWMMLVVFSNQSQPFKGKTASLQSSRQKYVQMEWIVLFSFSSVLQYKSCVQFFIYLPKNPSSFHVIHHPPDHQSPTFLALKTRGLRILIVALSSIILHLVSALVIPLLAAWLGFWRGGEKPVWFGRVGHCRRPGADSWGLPQDWKW